MRTAEARFGSDGLIFAAGWFASLQNIHEAEKELLPLSLNDAKSRWEVMVLMSFNTWQFRNVQGEQMNDKGWLDSLRESSLQTFLSYSTFEVKHGS